MTIMPRPICQVCHRPLEENDQYLVRFDGQRATAVHRSLCFPPARSADRKPAHHAAA
jgi:RNase P subunit RPR2